jgi:hypothetical protein
MYLAKVKKKDNKVVAMVQVDGDDVSVMTPLPDSEYWVLTFNNKLGHNFAAVGDTYFEDIDNFMPPKPYPSWVIDKNLSAWTAPKAHPDTDMTNCHMYKWSEDVLDWITTKDE